MTIHHPPVTEFAIVPAEPGDAAAIVALQRAAFASEAVVYGMELPPQRQTPAEVEADIRGQTVLKAMGAEGAIIGSVRGAVDEDGVCWIGKLIVDPAWQGRGIGRALMAAIECAFPDAASFALHTGHRSARNLSLYASLGYREFRRQAVDPALTMVFLSKPNPTKEPAR